MEIPHYNISLISTQTNSNMIFNSRKRFIFCISCAFCMSVFNTNAQDSLFQNVISKIDGLKNFSYLSTYKVKELWTNDTIEKLYHSVFIKAPGDRKFGYLLNVETRNESNKITGVDLYNGQNIIHFKPGDSSYNVQEELSFNMQSSLPGYLQWLQSRLKTQSVKVKRDSDTTIHARKCSHIIATVYDTIINNKRNYTNAHLFIDELTGMPDEVVTLSRSTEFGNAVSTYYSEIDFLNYKINQAEVNSAAISIPSGLRKQKLKRRLAIKSDELLPIKSKAPNWTLYDSEGKKMSLAQLKGKVVLMDFFFIGCGSCLEALKPLNQLHEKYKGQDVVIVSMTFRDSKKASAEFKRIYKIKYPIYIDAGQVVDSYKVVAFPTFYFINKEGKIANTIVGFDTKFEKKATASIDKLLAKF